METEYDFGAPDDVQVRADLHLHSTCSDGRLEPAGVVEAAKERGLAAVALTDHDTVAGIGAAAEAAEALGLGFVPGIELSTYDEAGSTHLLGYGIDPADPEFGEHLEGAREDRVERARKIVARLNRLGLEVTLEEVFEQAAPGRVIARPHIARALLAGGWVKRYRDAFDRFIAAGRPAYVPTQPITPAEGIRLIHAAGGLAVLAHPARSHGEEVIRGLVEQGLDGLETLHPDHGPQDVVRLRRLVRELGLLETGGSDWHGPLHGRHGPLASQPVPYEWYTRLRRVAARTRSGS